MDQGIDVGAGASISSFSADSAGGIRLIAYRLFPTALLPLSLDKVGEQNQQA
jgi:hypothetical protein